MVLVCAAYLGTSSLLILLNKFLLSQDGFSYPLILSGSGMFLTFIASSAIVHIPAVVPDRQVRCSASIQTPKKAHTSLPAFEYQGAHLSSSIQTPRRTPLLRSHNSPSCRPQVVTQEDYLHRILPLGFCSAATLALGNVAYLYLDVGLLQMLKSCCPVFVMLVAILFRLERFSLPLVASITFIALGTATTAATGALPPSARRALQHGSTASVLSAFFGANQRLSIITGLICS